MIQPRLKRLTQASLLPILLLATPALHAAVVDNTPTTFTVSEDTQIPGRTLHPGTYSIQIVDHLSDRMIVRVGESGGKQTTTFLALPASSLPKPASGGPLLVKGGSHSRSALRGFAFPDGTLAEFVYPKADAVSIAKANSTTVPAIDPASEGRNANQAKLSPEDLQMVTLWMLTPTAVGPNDATAAISAQRYQAPAQPASQYVANNSTPPVPAARPKPAMKVLPHTASYDPAIVLGGLFALLSACLLTGRRLTARWLTAR